MTDLSSNELMNQQPSVYGIGQQMIETMPTQTSLIL
jgi:hypothetical protein